VTTPAKLALPLLGLLACPIPPPAVDIAPPTVLSVLPAPAAADVTADAVIQVCFDAPLRADTVTDAAAVLSRADGHTLHPVAATVALDASATCLGISPASPLAPASHYQLELKNTLLGANGVALNDSKTADAYDTTFATVGPAATAILLVPSDGLPNAPLDLAQVVLAFSAPVSIAEAAAPFSILPGGGPSSLSTDGRLATAAFEGAPAGTAVQVAIAAGLQDPSGQLPATGGPLGFTLSGCSEGSAPNLGAALAIPRDVDAWVQFATDRPGLCGASVNDSSSADAGVLRATAATCTGSYDPCNLSIGCLCTLPVAGLGPGDSVAITPTLEGYDGQIGVGTAESFQTAEALPALVITEVLPGAKTVSFIELQNRGPNALDLSGVQLVDCGLSLGCASPKGSFVAFGPPAGVGSSTLAPNAYALLADATFAATSAPPDALILAPIAGDAMLHLSSTGYQSIGVFLSNPAVPVSTYDGSLLPQTGYSIERIDPGATDATPNDWAIATVLGGTPGACNSVTPGAECDP